MDHENKVKPTELFLKNAMVETDEGVEVYSLKKEFAKTKHLKKKGAWILLFFFMFAVLLGSALFAWYLQQKSQKTEIDISDFEDINIEELLGDAKRLEYKLNRAKADLHDLENTVKDKISEAKDQAARNQSLLISLESDAATRKLKMEKIQKNLKRKINRIRESFKKKVIDKKTEIATLEAQSAKKDSEVMNSAKKKDALMDSYDKLHRLEMEKQKDEYETRIREIKNRQQKEIRELKRYNAKIRRLLILKYNPRFALQQMEQNADYRRPTFSISLSNAALKPFNTLLAEEKILTIEEFRRMRQYTSLENTILERLNKIPYTNSVAPALNDVLTLNAQNILFYDNLWYRTLQALNKRKTLLEHYQWALQSYASAHRESGYILDARDKNNIIAFIDPVYAIESNQQAVVFRGDKEFVAKVALFPLEDRVRVQIIKESPSNHIQSLDKILVLINQEVKQ